jgi:uncharacterized protein GlcG (DUF336 family)
MPPARPSGLNSSARHSEEGGRVQWRGDLPPAPAAGLWRATDACEWAERTGPTSDFAGQRQLAEVIPLKGGIPFKIGNETIGAIDVSGSTTYGDENCAKAGAAKIADQLK